MNRAERRRKEKEQAKKEKTYTLTQSQIDQIRRDAVNDAVKISFTLMLALPMEVLIGDGYWRKSAKRKIPKFLDDLLSLYKSWELGVLTMEQLRADLWNIGGVEVEAPKGIERY